MKAETPTSFTAAFIGPEGEYNLTFIPDNDEGSIETTISGQRMLWHVETVEFNSDESLVLSGLTRGSEIIWDNCFWFILTTGKAGSKIEYWGDTVLFRTDHTPV